MNDMISVDISRARYTSVGKAHGVTPEELSALQPRVDAAHATLQNERRDGVHGFWDLYKDTATLDRVKAEAERFLARGYENLVILGIGGSALGTSALATALL